MERGAARHVPRGATFAFRGAVLGQRNAALIQSVGGRHGLQPHLVAAQRAVLAKDGDERGVQVSAGAPQTDGARRASGRGAQGRISMAGLLR